MLMPPLSSLLWRTKFQTLLKHIHSPLFLLLSMASNFIFTAVSKPCFLSTSTSSSPFQGLPKHALRINAVAQKWEPSKVVPQADNVLIRLEELPKKSTGGVLLPAIAVNFDRCLMGEVLSVGAEVDGVKAGTKVLFSDVKAYEVDLGKDARYCFCRAGDLMAVVE